MKKLLAVTLAAAVLAGMTGCGGSKGEPASSAAPAAAAQGNGNEMAETTAPETGKEPVTITFWHRDGNTTSNPIYAEVIKNFQEKYPWITVEYTGLASDSYTQKFNTAVVTESTPDVGTISDKDLYALVAQDALMQLDDAFNAWEERDSLLPNIVEQARFYAQDGNLYLLGYGKTQETSWYNTKWHEEKGIEPAGSIADLRTYCEEYAEDGTYYFSLRGGSGSAENLFMFILSYGGEKAFFNEDGTSTLNNPKVVEGLDFYANLYKDGLVSHDAISNGYREMVAEFGAGTAQYIMHNSSSVSEHTKNLGEGNFLPIRPLEGEDGIAVCKAPTFMGSVVFKNTEHPEEAVLFAEYLASAEGAGYVDRNEGRVPVNTGIYDQDWYKENPYFQIYAEFENDPNLVFAQFPIYLDGYAEYASNDIVADLQAVMMGDKTAQEACDKWAADLTRLQQEWMAD